MTAGVWLSFEQYVTHVYWALVEGDFRIWPFCACAMKTYAIFVAESPIFLHLIGNRGRGTPW